jgi:hypothetical protein
MRKLTEEEMASLRKGRCPFCGDADGMYEGPSGGISQNWFCGNDACQAGFNLAMITGLPMPGELIRPSNIPPAQWSKAQAASQPWWRQLWRRR